MDSSYPKHRLIAVGILLLLVTLAVILVPNAGAAAKGGKHQGGKSKAARAYTPPKGKIFAGVSHSACISAACSSSSCRVRFGSRPMGC